MKVLEFFKDMLRNPEADDQDGFDDDDRYLEDDYQDEDSEMNRPRVITSNRTGRRVMEVSLVRPSNFTEAQEICDHLLSGKAVVINLEGILNETAQRVLDFTSGSAYSIRGNLQKISNYIFIATPESVDLSGDFQDMLKSGELNFTGLNMRL